MPSFSLLLIFSGIWYFFCWTIKGLISGKHYDRCKRIHPLFTAAMELLHFKLCLLNYDNLSEREDLIKKEFSEEMTKSFQVFTGLIYRKYLYPMS